MAVESQTFLIARSLRGSQQHNTIQLRRIELIVDVPMIGVHAEGEVTVTYADGHSESLNRDDCGVIRVSSSRGDYVDLDFETDLGMQACRCFIVLGDPEENLGAWRRLVNLGYVDLPEPPPRPEDRNELSDALEEFQADVGLEATGILDTETAERLAEQEESETEWTQRDEVVGEDPDDAGYPNDPKATPS